MEQDPNESIDPNMLNPLSNQGYGKEEPDHISRTQANKKADKTDKRKAAEEAYKNRSMGEQTMQAALQMGVLVTIPSPVASQTWLQFHPFHNKVTKLPLPLMKEVY